MAKKTTATEFFRLEDTLNRAAHSELSRKRTEKQMDKPTLTKCATQDFASDNVKNGTCLKHYTEKNANCSTAYMF